MKFLSFIMAFLVLTLSIMPCADNNSLVSEGKVKSELSKSPQQHSDTEQDHCSPFCTCSCCSSFSINHFFAVVTVTSNYESNTTSSFLPSDLTGIAFPIWQPPQLV